MRRPLASQNVALCETTISITTHTLGLVHASHTMSEVKQYTAESSCLQPMYNIDSCVEVVFMPCRR